MPKNLNESYWKTVLLTWNELFFVKVTIFSTFPKRWKIWCSISNETGYSNDSTITLRTVLGPPWVPCVVWFVSLPVAGNGEPDAGDWSWLINAVFYYTVVDRKFQSDFFLNQKKNVCFSFLHSRLGTERVREYGWWWKIVIGQGKYR